MDPVDLIAVLIQIKDHTLHLGWSGRYFESSGPGVQEFFDDGFPVHAQYRVDGPGHSQVRNIGCALGHYLFVSGLNMGMGSQYRRYPAVEVIAKCLFLRGRLGMKINNDVIYHGADVFNYIIYCLKGAVDRGEENPSRCIYDR